MKQLLLLTLLFLSFSSNAQRVVERLIDATWEEWTFGFKEGYTFERDTTLYKQVRYYNHDFYKSPKYTKIISNVTVLKTNTHKNGIITIIALDEHKNVLVKGSYKLKPKPNVCGSTPGSCYQTYGIWEKYSLDGKLLYKGSYNWTNYIEVGKWERYHQNGQLKELYYKKLFAKDEYDKGHSCKTGNYERYYENGQLKEKGAYKAVVESDYLDSFYTIDKKSSQISSKTKKPNTPHYKSVKTGTWYYYKESGELERKEEY